MKVADETTHHDDKGVPFEKTCVKVGHQADRESTDSSGDVALVGEFEAGEVVAYPP